MLILLMQLSGCSEDENSLTAATTRGEGTISFLMNDTLFLPKGRCEIISANFSHILSIEPTNYDTSYNKLDDYIQMNIYVYNKNKNIRLYMTIDSVKEKNMYQIKNATITRLVYLFIRSLTIHFIWVIGPIKWFNSFFIIHFYIIYQLFNKLLFRFPYSIFQNILC